MGLTGGVKIGKKDRKRKREYGKEEMAMHSESTETEAEATSDGNVNEEQHKGSRHYARETGKGTTEE